MLSIWPSVAGGATAGKHGGRAADIGQCLGIGRRLEQAATAEILRQAEGDAGTAGDQAQVGAGSADVQQMPILDRIDDGVASRPRGQSLEGFAIAAAPSRTTDSGTRSTLAFVCRPSTRTRLASVIGVSG